MVLMQRLNICADQIVDIQCQAPIGGLIPLKFARPKNQFESLFSLPYALAVTALDGLPGLSSFTQERVDARDVADILTRIHVIESETCVAAYPDYESHSYGSRGEIRVQIVTNDGRRDSESVQISPGHPQRPMTWLQAQAKFEGCMNAAGFSEQRSKEIFPTLREFEKLNQFRSLALRLSKTTGNL
jgi:2-methylcitrate dehydratase PrpD